MRGSPKLNELLFDNLKGLEAIFEEYKESSMFTQDSAVKLMQAHKSLNKNLEPMTIQTCFIFSQMTVLDEQKGLRKYGYLEFVEFLDMFCRLAQAAVKMTDTIENKVHEMISIVWNDRYQQGVWNPEDWPIYGVNDEVDC